MNTHCLNCSKKLLEKRGDAKFCSQECKNKYGYLKRGGNLKGKEIPTQKEKETSDNLLEKSLMGVLETEDSPMEKERAEKDELKNDKESSQEKEQTQTTHKNTPTSLDAEFAREQSDQYTTRQNDSNKDPDYDNSNSNKHLPAKYISKEIQIENPLYVGYQNKLQEVYNYIQSLETEFKNLETNLKEQKSRNGDDLLFAGILGAGLVGLLSGSPSNQKKKTGSNVRQNDDHSVLGNILKVGFFTALGAGAGYVAKVSTQEWREKDRAEKIKIIERRMTAIRDEYQYLSAGVKKLQFLLKGTVPYSLQTIKELNPDYQKALNGLSVENSNKKPEAGEATLILNSSTINLTTKKTKPSENFVFKSDKIIKATDLGKREFKALNFQRLWLDFFGLPSLNCHILIHGNSGEGKSTFCLWFARYLAENFGRVLYVSGEEGVNKTFHDKLVACKAEVPNLYILDVRTGEEFMEEVGVNEVHFVVFDSLHDMEIDAHKLKIIFERYKNTAFICIDQNNKKGELLGANEKKHICDVVVNVKNYTAETTKNRFKAKGMSFKTADFFTSSKSNFTLPNKPNPESGKDNKDNKGDKDGNGGYDLDSDRRGII